VEGVSEIDWIARAGAKAKGKRPQYFDDPATDRILSIVMAVAGEVAVLRERLDTVERLLEAKGSISRADIEAYVPDRAGCSTRPISRGSCAACSRIWRRSKNKGRASRT
jgi:hypothetical protein